MNFPSDFELPSELEPFRGKITTSVKPFIRITGAPVSNLTRWESKFGGLPYFPKEMAYPRNPEGKPLILLAQINFATVPPLPDFPTSGILQYYIDAADDLYGLDFENPTRQQRFRVLYFPEIETDPDKLIYDFGFLTEIQIEYAPVERTSRLHFELRYAPVAPSDYQFENYLNEKRWLFFEQFGEAGEAVWDSYFEISKATGHKLGGYAFFTQEDPRGHSHPTHDTLLLQIDSDDKLGILWGDVGVANFFIRREDLRNRDFSNVLYNWDCC